MRRSPRQDWPYPVKEDVWSGPMPYYVPWTSGVLAAPSVRIASAEPNDRWRERW